MNVLRRMLRLFQTHGASVLLAAFVLLAACKTNNIDNDGFSVAEGDCNDHNPFIHPNAVERCNRLDDDCDGEVDESCVLDYGPDPAPTDTDADTNTDGDTDSDTDGDADTDTDSDTDSDADSDTDSDTDTDLPDTGDTDPSETGDTGDTDPGDTSETGDTAEPEPVFDADGDGVVDELDCAPDDPTRSPLLPEVCGNDVDENCDEIVEECPICEFDACTADLNEDGIDECLCFIDANFPLAYQTLAATAVGNGMFDMSLDFGDSMLPVDGFYCIDFSAEAAGETDVILVSTEGYDGMPADEVDTTNWVWWDAYPFCVLGDSLCELQDDGDGNEDWYLAVIWDPATGLIPNGNGYTDDSELPP